MLTVVPYSGQEFYELDVKGFKRKLPLVQVSPDTWIAYFDSLGDRDFVSHCVEELKPHLEGCEILMTSESKGIALVHELAKNLGHDHYIVCRKERKSYMLDPISVSFKPITSAKKLELFIDGRYRKWLEGKKVGIVDDIVSTRQTIDGMEKLATEAGGKVVKKAAILVEGSPQKDIFSLGILPVFKKK